MNELLMELWCSTRYNASMKLHIPTELNNLVTQHTINASFGGTKILLYQYYIILLVVCINQQHFYVQSDKKIFFALTIYFAICIQRDLSNRSPALTYTPREIKQQIRKYYIEFKYTTIKMQLRVYEVCTVTFTNIKISTDMLNRTWNK